MVFLLVRWNSVPLLSRATAVCMDLGRECDGHDNRVCTGVVSSVHFLFSSSRPFFDGLTGTGLLVSIPEVDLEGHFALSRIYRYWL